MSRIGCFCIFIETSSLNSKRRQITFDFYQRNDLGISGSNRNPFTTDIGNVSYSNGQPLTRLTYSSYCSKFCFKVFPIMNYFINIAMKNGYFMHSVECRIIIG
jgi:hypothetical protein